MISTGRGAGPHLEFERFALDALPRLVRFTAAMCADRGIAEDVVQEVLIRVHAAAAVAAVAVAFVVVLPGDDPQRPAAQASGSGPTWARPCTTTGRPHLADITLRPVAGLAATSLVTSACSGVATREIKTDRGHDSGYVAVFQRGVFDTSLLAHARPASGGGVHGYAAAIPADELQPGLPYGVSLGCVARNGRPGATTLTGPPACKYDVLAWRYAPGSWALLVISATTPPSFFGKHTVARQLEVAAAVDTAQPAQVRIPVRFDRLPRGLGGLAVTTYYSAAGRRSGVALDFGRTGQPGCAAGTVCTQFGQVALGPRSTAPHLTGEPVAVNRRTAYRYEGAKRPFFTLQLWTGTWLVDFGGKRAVSDQVLTEIARSAHYAASASMSTWFDTDDALPF